MINKINNEVVKMPNTGIVKYHVKLKFDVDGLVEKADIIIGFRSEWRDNDQEDQ